MVKAFCVIHLRLESSVFQRCIYTLVKQDAVLWFYVELGTCPNKLLKLLLFWFFIRKTNVLCRQHRPHHCVENICEPGPAAGPMSPVVHRHGTRSNNRILNSFDCVLIRKCSENCNTRSSQAGIDLYWVLNWFLLVEGDVVSWCKSAWMKCN